MTHGYTDEKAIQVLISLLKAHGIRKVIASPGATNVSFIGSIQYDPFFTIFSCVDERSAAYMACGLAAESDEPVVLSCTGATASRNYLPALTEAYYRKLPILAITSTQLYSRIGHHIAQVIDRTQLPKDSVKLSVHLPIVKDDDDNWDCEIKINKAILELSRNGGGPVHINLPTTYSKNYDVKELPEVRVIRRYTASNELPPLPKGKIGVFVGSHKVFSEKETKVLDNFCAANDAVVFCDHSSNYYGKYRVLFCLVAAQQNFIDLNNRPDLLIHIGEITGDYYTLGFSGKVVWRVSEDGEIRDTMHRLQNVFEIPEISFFKYYTEEGQINNKKTYYEACLNQIALTNSKIPDLPFSNIWIASETAHIIPKNSTIHFGILNSLRSWNFFELPDSVTSSSNVGGFGIDGGMSSLLGASLVNQNRLYYCVIGDLAFFYDLNSLGNRHVGNNVRILLVNNGKGTEFRQFNHAGNQFADDTDKYIAAAGHFGNKSNVLVKHFAEDLGYLYLQASNKEEFASVIDTFTSPEIKRSMILEVFTTNQDESDALEIMMSLETNIQGKAKQFAKKVFNQNTINTIKKIIDK
ncbi:2-succinyl-5-enolpyruvyl-6-hydroxy-3-cyclohexene-1-carboxylate synthase [Treponema zuelzerae]|uniref:2-succinyl-5-enolpyruvyl-6-hydroxy-3-cyclohexene-1-carboxylate synthase n=2 Tax=Teretinema zuelzerae TaxID=156 RepID=A0AAE3EG35_9SPIR|nr:2-succinyl-5-enolpyruvyl-6-hydroxy-3-cyclohexene-1-carboxylate synthase [Teretinema zuelzerae]